MVRGLGSSRWLFIAAVTGLAVLLSGSYCSWRGYYVPSGANPSAASTTLGPVGGFASVYVNGTEFADSNATFTIDGTAAAESQLRIGQVATVGGASGSSGTAATGTAASVAVTTKLLGPVAAIDLAAGTVTVLGQTVQITGDTSVGAGVAPTDVGGVAVGQLVAIDGYRTSTGLIASRFDLAAGGQTPQVAGVVANLNGFAQTFTISGTTIDYSTAAAGLPAQITNGSYVVASGGSVTAASTLSAALIAAQAEVPSTASGASGSIHGAVTRYGSATDFDVAGQAVTTSSTTTYPDGVSSDVAPDVEVEVSGSYDGAGVLDAARVALVPAATVRVVGPVSGIDASGRTLTVAGVTLGTASATRWDDRSATQLRTFGFTNLQIGDWIEARGAPASGTSATARVLERNAPPSPPLIELQDVAAAVANPTFTLTGITVSASFAVFSDANGVGLTRSAFFGQAAGRLVRARGNLSGSGTLVATSVVLRD
jgi:Domain of unknown function (DUF5666)